MVRTGWFEDGVLATDDCFVGDDENADGGDEGKDGDARRASAPSYPRVGQLGNITRGSRDSLRFPCGSGDEVAVRRG